MLTILQLQQVHSRKPTNLSDTKHQSPQKKLKTKLLLFWPYCSRSLSCPLSVDVVSAEWQHEQWAHKLREQEMEPTSFLFFFLPFFLLHFFIQPWNHWFSNVQLLLMSCKRWCSCKPFLQFIPVPQTSHWALMIMSNFPLRKILPSPYVLWSVGLDVIRVYCTDPLWEKRLRAVDPLIHPRI